MEGFEPIGVRVLKIASFEGPGFLGNTLFCRKNPCSISGKKHSSYLESNMAPSLSVSKSTGLFLTKKNSPSPLWHKVSEKKAN